MWYDSVIFDNDGVLTTLTDSLHYVGAREAFDELGVVSPSTAHVEAMSIGVTCTSSPTSDAERYRPRAVLRARDEALTAVQRALIRAERNGQRRCIVLDRLTPAGCRFLESRDTVAFALEHDDTATTSTPSGHASRQSRASAGRSGRLIERAMDALTSYYQTSASRRRRGDLGPYLLGFSADVGSTRNST